MLAVAPVEHPSSPLVRVALLAYTFLIIYASLYPFSGWHQTGIEPWAYLSQALPHYWTGFDVGIDVVGYIPFGTLLVLACYPWIPRGWAVLVAFLIGTLLSGSMEATQTFLPSRVASNLDLATNSLGTLVGALLGWVLMPWLLERDLLKKIRQRWFVANPSNALILVALWPLAQIYPQGTLFGLGQIVPILSNWMNTYLGIPIDLGEFIRQGSVLTVEQYWLSETIITSCGLTGAVLLLVCQLQPRTPRAMLAGGLIAINLALKSLALALLFKPEHAYSWLTPGAQAGLIVGVLMLTGLTLTPARVQRRLALLMLILGLLVINIVPANPYFTDTMAGWVQGKFLNFNGAAQFLSVCWPWLAIWFLLHYPSRKLS